MVIKNLSTITASVFLIFALVVSYPLTAQDDDQNQAENGYEFTDIDIIPHTSVKDQHRSGTCWSYAGTSFIEAEVMRNGGPVLDLSEMLSVRDAYERRANNYMRLHGKYNFGPGGEPHQVMETIARKGMTTEEAYTGLTIGEDLPVHGEMDNVLRSFVKAVEENKNRKLSPVWSRAYNGILDAYLGEIPQEFEFGGMMYSPETFAREVIGLNPDDYVEITSFTHANYYEPFLLKIPDNWDYEMYYNVPLDELELIINAALENGYTIAWAADVSDRGFNHRKGMALVPEKEWDEMEDGERDSVFITPVTQRQITPEIRQKAYNNYTTTDDHSMHIVGTAEDQDGNIWYKVKNSWADDSNDFGGYFYASVPYIRYKTIAIYVNKGAVPRGITRKMNW